MNWRPIRGWTKLLHERGMKADSMPERLLIGPGSPPSLDPVYPELSPPLEPCPFLDQLRPQLFSRVGCVAKTHLVLLFSRGGASSKTRRTLQPLKRKPLQGGLNSTTPTAAAAIFSLPSRHASGRPRRMASSR